jgi:3-hydroxyethyl bacteriochlorophyllide a dehydrogenase
MSQGKLTFEMSCQPISRSDPTSERWQQTRAVVFEAPETLTLRDLRLPAPGPGEVVVEVDWSGISTGTEKLLWHGTMPPFPGMGYPLVPGYETVGHIVATGTDTQRQPGERVFVSGASCYGDVHGLFGGAASRLVVGEAKTLPLAENAGEEATLLALAATAHHALMDVDGSSALPDLIVGHGVLGRLVARLVMALGGTAPVVWETNAARRIGATGYDVVAPEDDDRTDYRRIVDVSGDSQILDRLVPRLGRHGEIVLAGFYPNALAFTFPAAFMREARFRIAAEWLPRDLQAAAGLAASGDLSLAGLITHRVAASRASDAYAIAFSSPDCLKMIMDWRNDA